MLLKVVLPVSRDGEFEPRSRHQQQFLPQGGGLLGSLSEVSGFGAAFV